MTGLHPNWKHIERIDGLVLWLGELDNGKWLAMRDKSPKFVFEEDTIEAAVETATRAIAFWRKAPKGGRRVPA